MEYKQIETQGNDCMIYKTVSLLPIGYDWIVIIAKKYSGNWFDDSEVETITKLFNSEDQAIEYYENIK